MKKSKVILLLAALLGALAILLGAFGAHGLKDKLTPEAMDSFETAVRYMMYHVLAVILIQNLSGINTQLKNSIGTLFLTGILLFSGSIFLITLGWVEAKSIWFITPLGGIFFILGWITMVYGLLKEK